MRDKRRLMGSMSARLRILLLVFVPVFLVTVAVGNSAINYTKNQTSQYLVNTVELYVKEIDKTMANINRRLRTLLVGTTQESIQAAGLIDTIEKSESQVLVNHAINQLKLIFGEFTLEYGNNINFFLYVAQRDNYIRCTDGYLSQRDYRKYEERIVNMIKGDTAQASAGVQTWRFFSADDGQYAIMKVYNKQDIYMGCWILAEDLVAPLRQMDFGKNGAVLVSDYQGNYLAGQEQAEAQGLDADQLEDGLYRPRGSILASQLVITRRFSNVPCMVKLFIANYGTFERLLYIQMSLVFVAILMFACMTAAVYYLQRGILKPVRNFTKSLQQIEAGYANIDSLSHNDLIELDKANAEFAKLLGEVEKLKLAVYEQELEKRSIQLDYFKLQIKPHFYLNCLNFIYNMIDLGEYDNARQMSRITADYLRYLFKNGDGFVTLAEEIDHVGDYMQIQKMRYVNALRYETDIDGQAALVRIPPMTIQTFVENSIKHALTLEGEVLVRVDARVEKIENEPRAVITIRDTGSGFDPQVLSQLINQGSVRGKDGSGVGIDNCLKRLHHYYGGKASVSFQNAPEGGAVVKIFLPLSICEKGGAQLP